MTVWKAGKEDSGSTLQKFLQNKLKGFFSLKEIKLGLQRLSCKLNQRIERFGSRRLNENDIIEWLQESPFFEKVEFDKKRILYEDDFLLSYDKPASANTLENGILEQICQNYKKVKALHRLDKDTSGVLLFAKTDEVKDALEKLFRDKSIKKTYLALISGRPEKTSFTISNYLGKVASFSGQTIYGPVSPKYGKIAETKFEVLKRGEKHALLRCFPLTGRTHQIRSHLKLLGLPIVGDIQYGWNESLPFKIGRFFLHAFSIEFIHPKTGNWMKIESKVPADFEEAESYLL